MVQYDNCIVAEQQLVLLCRAERAWTLRGACHSLCQSGFTNDAEVWTSSQNALSAPEFTVRERLSRNKETKARKLRSEFPKLAIGNAKHRFVPQTSLFQLGKKCSVLWVWVFLCLFVFVCVFFVFFKTELSFSKQVFTEQNLSCSLPSVPPLCFLDHVMNRPIKLSPGWLA